jgi:transposase
MQYGVNIEALAVSLNTVGMVSINRTHEILSGVFGIPISTGTISAMVSDCAETVTDPVKEIKEAILEAPIANVDETGTRVDKQTVWAHVVSTDQLTYIEVQPSRGKKGMDAIGILLAYLGTIIHDCWASYFCYTAVRHGLCNAHLLRELAAVLENTKQAWAQALIDLLLQMKSVKETLRSQNKRKPTRYSMKKFSLLYDKILSEALQQNPIPAPDPAKKGKPKRGKTGALVDRLILHKDKYLLFFADFSVPFDNNQAERDIRMFKVKQKVSGCFRTMEGARNFAALMSYIGTARKHGISGFIAIKNALLGTPFSVKSLATTEELPFF